MAVKLNLASGSHPLEGFENLDLENGWHFEDGLPYPDASVEGISESHGLMFVALKDWPFVFSEIARVLEPGGVVRVTEDATDDPASERYGGFPGAVTLTSKKLVARHMRDAGLAVSRSKTTRFRDSSLVQEWHGLPPKTFALEGVKP